MKVHLTIQERLKDLRVERGLNLRQLAELVDIPASTLSSYEQDEYREIASSNLVKLSLFYKVSADYLLCLTDSRQSDHRDIGELHLDDKALSLLRNGAVNNRLLSEFICHKNFIQFLQDLEIFVDGHADMILQSVNIMVDKMRRVFETLGETGTEKVPSTEPVPMDLNMRLLSVAHVSDIEYFTNLFVEDLKPIVSDIRDRHRRDRETSTDRTMTETFDAAMEKALSFMDIDKYMPTEKPQSFESMILPVICGQLGISPNSLSEEERTTLVNIMKRTSGYKEYEKNRRNNRMP